MNLKNVEGAIVALYLLSVAEKVLEKECYWNK